MCHSYIYIYFLFLIFLYYFIQKTVHEKRTQQKKTKVDINIRERKIIKNEKRCRYGMPKSTQIRKDKSDGKYTKPHPSLHLFTKEQRCCIFTITFIFPCSCTFWHAIPTSLFIFNDFSFLFLHFFGHILIYVVK